MAAAVVCAQPDVYRGSHVLSAAAAAVLAPFGGNTGRKMRFASTFTLLKTKLFITPLSKLQPL